MVNVLRHILGAENPEYLRVKRKVRRDEKILRKLGRVEKEELVKLEAYYAKLFWEV